MGLGVRSPHQVSRLAFPVFLAAVFACGTARGQLFDNLAAFGSRLNTGDPAFVSPWPEYQGPKNVVAGDLDGDGVPDIAASNTDGSVTVYFQRGGGRFSGGTHLRTGAQTLRGIALADLDGDGLGDIAAAAPLDAAVFIFKSRGGGAFAPPAVLPTWHHARNLAAGDFDGDGRMDLAVAGPGGGLRQYRGTGGGEFAALAAVAELDFATGSTRPVYSLKAVRRPGAARDELVATHALTTMLWTLAAGPSGALEVTGRIPLTGNGNADVAYYLDAGSLTAPASEGRIDLVTAHRNSGVIQVRRGNGGPALFEPAIHQEIAIPGGPRAVRIVDLDGDGWNDLAVVLRYLDRVIAYHNEGGTLVPASEMPVGGSPRDLAPADFNGDGHPDLAVINRYSSDISILTGYPGRTGFGALDQFYLVDGDVAGLDVIDFNGDGRDDVVQLHRASNDVSVRLANPDGSLAAPTFYTIGRIPADMVHVDVNNDGLRDLLTANIGINGIEDGSISVRLGLPGGGLGPERRYQMPPEVGGRLFSIAVADFDADGNVDIAAGLADCRIGFFRGQGDGSFTLVQSLYFTYEAAPQAMASGDFDQDGDLDFAAASMMGNLVVVENRGDLLSSPELHRQDYPPSAVNQFGTQSMIATDLNRDGDLDLVVGSGNGAVLYHGAAGMRFDLRAEFLPGTQNMPASSLASGDFDGDGKLDIAVSCQILSCLTILTQGAADQYLPALTVDVPAGRLVDAGDLDGDGHADLVGSGEVLWTALSSRRARLAEPPVLADTRTVIPTPVINEILSINNEVPLPGDDWRKSDFVEFFGGAAEPTSLAHWRLTHTRAGDPEGTPPREFAFPPDASLESRGHLLVIFSNDRRSPYHTGFRLSGDGGVLTLIDAAGSTVDRVEFAPQQENVSYGRYRDGVPAFAFSNYPSPGRANDDNGPVEPILNLRAAGLPGSSGGRLEPPAPGQPIRFIADARDDVGIVTMSLLFQRLDVEDRERQRVVLYDDGLHEDGAMMDGLFAGDLEFGLSRGAEIRFQVEVEDFSGAVSTIPEELPGQDPSAEDNGFYTLAIGFDFPRLEISEVVSRNDTGLRDESGGTPDWVEVRNCSGAPLPLGGYFLGDRFPASEKWFAFPAGITLGPGEHLIVYCDGNEGQGPLHAPFNLSLGGGQVILAATTPRGAHQVIDSLHYGAQKADRALARIGCGGSWGSAAPTPAAPNTPLAGDVNLSGDVNITDPIVILNHLFLGGSIACRGAADANGDGRMDLSDASYLLNFLFLGGPAASPPAGCE